MPYKPLDINPVTPPKVKGLIHLIENHYFHDVHCMLRLPILNYRLDAGCNFAITQVLTAVIGGISVTLYQHHGGNGNRFKGVLTHYYPWNLEPNNAVTPIEGADAIYSIIRNPITHNLGLDLQNKAKTQKVAIKRLATKNKQRGLTEKMIENLEKTIGRIGMSPTVVVRSDATVLLVEALYWGVRVMIKKLTYDISRMQLAEAYLSSI